MSLFATKKRITPLGKIVREGDENRLMKKINSLLSRKDIINLDNQKVDALRMLAFHLESNREMTAADFVKFLKS